MKNHFFYRYFLQISILGFLLLTNGCDTPAAEIVYITPTHTITPLPSPTIEWFPATSTPTFVPTIAAIPTDDLHPAVGEILLNDQFNNNQDWSLAADGGGSINLGRNELTLVVQEPNMYVASLNSSITVQDVYLEVTSNVSLCKAEDSYGILLRAGNPMDAYRFLVNCQGQVRLERLNFGRPSPLVNWKQSGQVLPGSPLKLRLQVWAVKNELRFFINDVFQFSARDTILTSGKMGVFARQSADTPVTVSFSDVIVRAIEPGYTLPKPTALPTATSASRIAQPPTITPSVR